MLDGGFIELKLRYEDLAAGDFVRSDDIYAGGHTWRVLCYPRGGGAMNSNGQRIGGEYLSIKLDLVTRSTNVRAIFAAFLVHLDGHPSPVHAKSFVAVYPLGAGGRVYSKARRRASRRRRLHILDALEEALYGDIMDLLLSAVGTPKRY
ncbi:hypothetical protein OsJ_27986 [Oryza sativa Japonica Group]|uniref:MATH domain-containing protein n=1 Tax=Oryza sativa subsp. japonica TaxID=39947 RepID=B9G1V1_ORYSJ|nr:hypothetical protein OsJ_27986 [Oryza sativa Japonica Group]